MFAICSIVTLGNVGYMFNIDPKLGVVTLARSLDISVRNEYELTIMANDMGKPSLSSTCNIEVRYYSMTFLTCFLLILTSFSKLTKFCELSTHTQNINLYEYILHGMAFYSVCIYKGEGDSGRGESAFI